MVRKLEKPGRSPIYFLKGETGAQIEILPATEKGGNRELKDSGLSHVGIVVDDIEEIAAYLASQGVSVHNVRHTSQGWWIGYFEDPEGNALEVVQR